MPQEHQKLKNLGIKFGEEDDELDQEKDVKDVKVVKAVVIKNKLKCR